MRPRPKQRGDGLSGEQQRLLLAMSVGIGAIVLLSVLGLTAASHVFGPGGGQSGPPDAAFTIQTVERGDGVAANITHAGGQAATPGDVVVSVDGESRGNWSALGGEGLDIVGPGHSVVVEDVQPGDEVQVRWIGGEAVVVLDYNTIRGPSGS